jgi:hypothetical protein
LRSSDQRREGFRTFIELGNSRNWFKDPRDDKSVVQVPMLQPLRDVKTRWDSVYMMVRRLRALRPVSSSQALSDWTVSQWTNPIFNVGHRSVSYHRYE